jgi:2-methylfumaryl-CoA hydratase
VAASDLLVPTGIRIEQYDTALSGSTDLWNDYQVGERIDHVDGMTIEESEHMMATRLYQNTARVHFNQQAEKAGRFGRRLIYGGHIISLARSLSFNGLANAFSIAAINGGRHVAPAFAGDTIYAWSEVSNNCSCRDARTSARCGCVPSRPRTSPARIFPTRPPMAVMIRACCSTSTIRC